MNVRDNWRVVLLVVFVVLSSVALFAPTGDSAPDSAAASNQLSAAQQESNASNATNTTVTRTVQTDDGPTNLRFGLELSGGTRIRAPLVGMTAEGVEFSAEEETTVEREVASELGVSELDVEARAETSTVELFTRNATTEEFSSALQGVGYDVSTGDIRDGVTEQTLETAVQVLEDKISGAGSLQGGDVAISRSADQSFVLVEVPGATRGEVLELIGDRGQVVVVAHFPGENGTYRNVPLFTQDGIAGVGQVREDENGQPVVPTTLTTDAARNLTNAMQRFGFTEEGVNACRTRQPSDSDGYCLYTVRGGGVVDGEIRGEVVYKAGIRPSLAQLFANGDFVQDPSFSTSAPDRATAQQLKLDLQAGALPTELDVDSGTSYYLQPTLAERFKTFSVVTGLVAMVAVTGVVFARYRQPGVALPMALTAAAEVYILLGFAAAVGLALDLSHIAGFIAVIGTGVDDLVIIADEILQSGDVKTGRVFESRFRKAFWVIGAAAATTIIALSPLAVLSLGDLQGFAIVTIVGVLVGVLVTRPAYGDILRSVVLD
ncbi:preprotein translocase subunit SecD [Halomarina oriensis]|uniref:Protein-export membrane protein SecD n=1 Tax=Halomarina oriensis TaxID=671145 RepID=A0A6B0GFW2_9EURY|nr:preprotein translocase subunit SecD [Halomarina oriensis]